MQKGLQSRFIVHKILIELKSKKISFDHVYNSLTSDIKLKLSDKKLIYTVVLGSMRNYFKVNKIIQNYTKKMNKNSDQYYLLLSGITQLIFLQFKDYAVINSTVEIAKNKKINAKPSFINGVLRNVLRNKKKLLEIKIEYNDLPKWFLKKTKNINKNEKLNFLKTIEYRPDLHLVFKQKKDLEYFNKNVTQTSNNSIALHYSGSIENLPNYELGNWWVQDFSAMLPLYLTNKIKDKKVVDMCAAPGGKTFQIIEKKGDLVSYEISSQRAEIMNKNLKRLKYNISLNVKDSLKINNQNKFDIVLIDAPCSSVGTIRRNPEIFFRSKGPAMNSILLYQAKFLEKAKLLLNKKGIIIYIVCSFLFEEGENQINNFLKNNKNFSVEKYFSSDSRFNEFINSTGYFFTLPKKLKNNILIDGFFAAKLIKND